MKHEFVLILIVSFGSVAGMRAAQQSAVSPQVHAQHHDDINKRGDQVMGFDHLKTTHHFLLRPDGGVIQVEANDPKIRLAAMRYGNI